MEPAGFDQEEDDDGIVDHDKTLNMIDQAGESDKGMK